MPTQRRAASFSSCFLCSSRPLMFSLDTFPTCIFKAITWSGCHSKVGGWLGSVCMHVIVWLQRERFPAGPVYTERSEGKSSNFSDCNTHSPILFYLCTALAAPVFMGALGMRNLRSAEDSSEVSPGAIATCINALGLRGIFTKTFLHLRNGKALFKMHVYHSFKKCSTTKVYTMSYWIIFWIKMQGAILCTTVLYFKVHCCDGKDTYCPVYGRVGVHVYSLLPHILPPRLGLWVLQCFRLKGGGGPQTERPPVALRGPHLESD